jgi:hypothetical protein
MAWMIVREGDAEPEYFASTIFSEADNWVRDPARAKVFLSRRGAVFAMQQAGLLVNRELRIVPTFASKDWP